VSVGIGGAITAVLLARHVGALLIGLIYKVMLIKTNTFKTSIETNKRYIAAYVLYIIVIFPVISKYIYLMDLCT